MGDHHWTGITDFNSKYIMRHKMYVFSLFVSHIDSLWCVHWHLGHNVTDVQAYFLVPFCNFLNRLTTTKTCAQVNEKNRGIETSICVDSSTWAKGSLLCFHKIILKYDSYNERKSNNHKELQTDSHSVVCVYCCVSCHSINSFRIFTNLKVTCFYFVLLFL